MLFHFLRGLAMTVHVGLPPQPLAVQGVQGRADPGESCWRCSCVLQTVSPLSGRINCALFKAKGAGWVKAEMGHIPWMEGGNLPLGQCCSPQATLFFCMSETFCMDPCSRNSGDHPAHGEPVCFELKPLYSFQSIFT